MNLRSTFAFLAAFAALAAYLLLVDQPRQEASHLNEENASLVLPGLDPELVTAVTLGGAAGTVRMLRGTDGSWSLTAPVHDRGNAGRVQTLLADLGSLKAEREVAGDDADLEPYGLSTPDLLVALEGPALILAVGAENPAGDARYLRAGNGPVVLVKSAQVAPLILDPDDLRQQELLVDARWEQLAAVEVRPSNEPPLRLERDGERWWIRQPVATEADAEAVGRLTGKLRWARASSFPDDDDDSVAALENGTAVRLEWRNAASPTTVVELARVGESVLARSSERDTALVVAADVWAAVHMAPETLRRRKPLLVKAWKVEALEVTRGAENRVYRKEEGAWQRAGVKLVEEENGALQSLLEALEETAADEVIDAGADDRPYGLQTPMGMLTVETSDGLHQELKLGQVGDRLYARGEEAGPIYALPAAFTQRLADLFAEPWPAAGGSATGTSGDPADR